MDAIWAQTLDGQPVTVERSPASSAGSSTCAGGRREPGSFPAVSPAPGTSCRTPPRTPGCSVLLVRTYLRRVLGQPSRTVSGDAAPTEAAAQQALQLTMARVVDEQPAVPVATPVEQGDPA
jgi:hypothetical protein